MRHANRWLALAAGLLAGLAGPAARADIAPGPTEIGVGVLGVAVVAGAVIAVLLLVLRLRRGRKKG
jgi:hypothetical protein